MYIWLQQVVMLGNLILRPKYDLSYPTPLLPFFLGVWVYFFTVTIFSSNNKCLIYIQFIWRTRLHPSRKKVRWFQLKSILKFYNSCHYVIQFNKKIITFSNNVIVLVVRLKLGFVKFQRTVFIVQLHVHICYI